MTVEQDPHWAASVAWLVQVLRSVGNDGAVRAPVTAPTGIPADALARAADFHGVAGFARLAVAEPTPELTALVHAAQARHLRALDDLHLVVGALGDAGVDVLVVKGPALVATCYAGPPLRSYVDLDIAVRPADLGRAVEALEGAGCTLLDANWPLLTELGVKELFVEGRSGGAIDLHWGLGGSVGTSAPVDRLMESGVELETSTGVRYRTLAPWDFAVEVAVHAALSGGHRLVWLTDLRGALDHAARVDPDGSVGLTVSDWGAGPAVDLMVRRAHRSLGVPVPPGLPLSARVGPWPALARVADAIAPPSLVGGGGAVSRLVARSCRSTQLGSLGAAAGKARAWRRDGRSTRFGTEVLLSQDDPRSGFFPAGGPQGRQAFFDRVAHEG
jgi:hypothetical protein